MHLRPVNAEDQDAIVALIDSVYREYGDRICREGADGDLLDVEGYYVGRGGAFVVLDDPAGRAAGRHVRGTHAVLPDAERQGMCSFRRLYLDPELRGGPWGLTLMQWAVRWAKDRGMVRVEFWSDVRFRRAHAFFERFGFTRGGIRDMDDGTMPYREHFFSMDLK